MIRKTARIISPKSPFYVWKTETDGYCAFVNENFTNDYSINISMDGSKELIPLKCADFVVIGYTKYIYNYTKTRFKWKLRQQKFIECVKRRDFPYIFPLLEYTRTMLDKEFAQLPEEIRMNTVSSTRDYNYGGKVFIPPVNYEVD